MELTALASRAARDDLPVASAGSVAAVIDRAHAAQTTAEVHVGEPEGANCELHTSESTAELAAKIAKEFQDRALEDFKLSMNAALDYAKDFVEARGSSGGASKAHPKPKDQILTSLGAAAQCRAKSLELAKANLDTALDYARAFVRARSPAEFVELSSAHAREQCELMLKQASVLKAFAKAVTKSGTD